jgi:predicted ATP-grasp superfamily ATP-dependent carboligase
MTRAEAYSVLMKSICVHPDTNSSNWQKEVAREAKELGFTVRSVSTFEPNKLILRQELYALAARIAEYKEENPDTCDNLPDELICEE